MPTSTMLIDIYSNIQRILLTYKPIFEYGKIDYSKYTNRMVNTDKFLPLNSLKISL